jgi:hypothetical protein
VPVVFIIQRAELSLVLLLPEFNPLHDLSLLTAFTLLVLFVEATYL